MLEDLDNGDLSLYENCEWEFYNDRLVNSQIPIEIRKSYAECEDVPLAAVQKYWFQLPESAEKNSIYSYDEPPCEGPYQTSSYIDKLLHSFEWKNKPSQSNDSHGVYYLHAPIKAPCIDYAWKQLSMVIDDFNRRKRVMAKKNETEFIIHQYDEYIGKNFGGMFFAGGYDGYDGPCFKFIKADTPPEKFNNRRYQIELDEGEMSVLVQRTFGVKQTSSSFSTVGTKVKDTIPDKLDSIADFEEFIRNVIREEIDSYFNNHLGNSKKTD